MPEMYVLASKLPSVTCSRVVVKRGVLSNELTHVNLTVMRPLVASLTT